MIKVLLPLCVIFFIVLYMVFAFVNWDIAWVAHVDVIASVAFYLAFCGILSYVFSGLFGEQR